MANGHPKIGGTNGVPELDLGQIGGVRQGAGSALFSGNLLQGPEAVTIVPHELPQQSAVFQDNLGYRGGRVTLRGIVRASSTEVFRQIVEEINERLHGSVRAVAGGELQAADLSRIKETQLTGFDGIVLSNRAVITGWNTVGRTRSNSEWAVIQQITIDLELLG